MNDFKALREKLNQMFIGLTFAEDEPMYPDGIWWLNISSTSFEHMIVIDWDPTHSQFGINTCPNPDPDSCMPFSAADEYVDGLEEALERVSHLIRTGHHTVPSWKV